ncbi:MAG TPA: YbdD/YjiX family protein [Gemmatimonadaceae bacterium]|nr:YbdD/YjiX family protein [Gemmatimonadaceae bacterium]
MPRLALRASRAMRTLARILRAVAGVPDYDCYVAHMRARHPGCALLSEDEFVRRRLDERYARPGSRCC